MDRRIKKKRIDVTLDLKLKTSSAFLFLGKQSPIFLYEETYIRIHQRVQVSSTDWNAKRKRVKEDIKEKRNIDEQCAKG